MAKLALDLGRTQGGESREGWPARAGGEMVFTVGASRWCRCCGAACRRWRGLVAEHSGFATGGGEMRLGWGAVGDSHSWESEGGVLRMAVWHFAGFEVWAVSTGFLASAGLTSSLFLVFFFLCTNWVSWKNWQVAICTTPQNMEYLSI